MNQILIMITGVETITRILVAMALGAVIGFERESEKRPAGLRTHVIVCVAATLFTILSFEAFPGSDPARIAAAIVTGIGFIGAGCILKSGGEVIGVTTAASLWITTAIGMAIGVGYYLPSILVTLIVFAVLRLKKIESKLHD